MAQAARVAAIMSRAVRELERGRTVIAVCLVLAAMVWAVYAQTLRHDFVNYDDNRYVYDNPVVSRGLSGAGLGWALAHPHGHNWHPLTSLSHMVDVSLFGLDPGGHHATSVLLHTATVLALFLLLHSMTASLWRSAFVAAVFAVHPLRVESVAWISERKDVLSGLFFMLTLLAYSRHVRKVAGRRAEDGASEPCCLSPVLRPLSSGLYWSSLLLFALGLLSKAMLVTLPLVLLLLDCWPLGRCSLDPRRPTRAALRTAARLLAEKVPFLFLSAVSCVITVWAQQEAIAPLERLPFAWRLENAVCAYAVYIKQLFLPFGLVVFYPPPGAGLPLWKVGLSLAALAVISAAVVWWRKRHPYLMVGWLWYLGMLVPVIGLVQVGKQAHADRYTYLPQIGLALLVTWLVAELSARWRHRTALLAVVSTVVLAALMAGAWLQAAHWRDSRSLWERAVAHTEANEVAHNNLAVALAEQGDTEAAIAHFEHALRIEPDDAEAHKNLGVTLAARGDVDAAAAHFQQALRIDPQHAGAHNNLGLAMLRHGAVDAAILHFQHALRIDPGFAKAHNNLGQALTQQGRSEAALPHFREALRITPDYASAHVNLAIALASQGSFAEAAAQYEAALAAAPDEVLASNNLAWLLATCPQARVRNGERAVELARRAERLSTREHPAVLGTLAAAYAEAGRFPEAVAAARRAVALADEQGNQALAEQTRQRLSLYEQGWPYHEP